MGIDITGFSKARRVGRHSDETCEQDEHYPVGSCRKFLDGRKPNCCYVCEGKHFYLYASYGAFDTWQNALSLVVYGVPSCEAVDHPRKYKGKPFIELIDFPFSNDVGFGPVTSARLYEDFEKYAAKTKKGFQRLTAEAAARSAKSKKRPASSKNYTARLATRLMNGIGGMVVGGDDDPESIAWEWKWAMYLEFRRAFKLASDDGLVLMSI